MSIEAVRAEMESAEVLAKAELEKELELYDRLGVGPDWEEQKRIREKAQADFEAAQSAYLNALNTSRS